MRDSVAEDLGRLGVIPVLVIERAEDTLPIGRALIEGGLPCAEVTFRSEAALEAISILARELPQLLLGAGTVLSTEQVDRSLDAGARFIVAPGFNPKVGEHCLKRGADYFPGICTPSEIESTLDLGLSVLKFFPAEAAGGISYLKAISAPYSGVRFIPTGGISPANLGEYLGLDQVLACGGTWLLRQEWAGSERWDRLVRSAAEARRIAKIAGKGA